MADYGMSVFTANGVDYTINDPNIAPEFDPAAAYTSGSYVYHGGDLYLLTADHTAGTAWEDTAKSQATLTNVLRQMSENELHRAVTVNAADSVRIRSGDLNTYTNPGNYHVQDSGDVQYIQNMPDNEPGRLIVMHTATANNVQHVFVTTAGYVYLRMKNALGWSAWTRLAYRADFENAVTLTASGYHSIPANGDLDSYGTPGEYAVPTSTIARSLAHMPEASPGKLIVMQTATNANITQIYMTDGGNLYSRIQNALGWGEWKYLIAKTQEERRIDNAEIVGFNNRIQALMALSDYSIAFANAPKPMSMKNYLGNTQNIHPKVLYFPGKFGGHYYWMAYTPYPNGNDVYENPCIAYSDDGYAWTGIAANPLDAPSDDSYYNSDTHLVYRDGVLECWYRAVVDVSGGRTEKIYRQTSSDGITWSAKGLVYETNAIAAARLLSPAVIWDGANYNIWVVDNGVVTYYTAPGSNVSNWTMVRRLPMTFSDSGAEVNAWHLDVIKDDDTYIMVIMTMNGDATGKNRRYSLFYATSQDNITYTTPKMIVKGSNSWDNLMYRACIVKVGSLYRIYYSALDYYNVFGMAITQGTSLDSLIGAYI